jgi:putative membrane protein
LETAIGLAGLGIAPGPLGARSAALQLTAPAFAQSAGEKTGVNSTLGISPTTADFVKEVAISDMFELQSNKLA